MSKDSFSILFRQSNLATFHPKLEQLYFNRTTRGKNDGPYTTFGLKRPIPRVNCTDIITLGSLTGPFGMVEHKIQNSEYDAFQLLRRIAFHVGVDIQDESLSNSSQQNRFTHSTLHSKSTTVPREHIFFSKSNQATSEPLFVKGKILRKLWDGGFLVNIQDCWVGLLPSQNVKGIDTRFLVTESPSDQPKGSWHTFQVKSFTWIPKSQTAKIYLSLASKRDVES